MRFILLILLGYMGDILIVALVIYWSTAGPFLTASYIILLLVFMKLSTEIVGTYIKARRKFRIQ